MNEVIEYYSDGLVYKKYYVDRNGDRNGIESRWYQDGQLQGQFLYKNGKMEGYGKLWLLKYKTEDIIPIRYLYWFCFWKNDFRFGQQKYF